MLEAPPRSRLPAVLLLAGDLACFLAFAVIGLRSHEDGVTASGVLRAAVPFQAGWLVFSTLLGLQSARAAATPRRVLIAWVPSWALGLALRTLVFGRAFAPAFAVISFITNAVLLVGWRFVVGKALSTRS